MCIFCKIAAREIPSEKVLETKDCVVIKDLNPQAPVHLLLIPKKHFKDLADMTEEDAVTLGKSLKTVADRADELGLKNGFRVVSNKGEDGCQSVQHLHFHILGGKKLSEKMC